MTTRDLINGICKTRSNDCNAWENQYSEELCRRHGNLKEYKLDPEQAVKDAARGYGIVIY